MVRWMNLLLPVALVGFGLVWMLGVVPSMMNSTGWTTLNPPEQYIVYNFGLFLIITVFFGGMVSFLMHRKLHLLTMLLNGLAGMLFFSFVLDMFEPPFALNSSGQFLIPTGATISGAAVDWMTAWSWQTTLGIHGPLLYDFTYIVTPILAVIVTVLLLGANRFLKFFQEVVL